MSDVKLTREFALPPETVFEFVTQPDKLLRWWGHDGMKMAEHELDFSKPGRWSSTLIGSEGGRFKMSGMVTTVERPNLVEFTWAWHDDADQRGEESIVRFELSARGEGTQFVVFHADLKDKDTAVRHQNGWTSTLRRLERLFQ